MVRIREHLYMRGLRNKDPEAFHLVSTRTVEARLWIPPNAKVRKLLGGIVARYQEKLSIEIYAYNFLGNHYHALIRAPLGNASEFFENLNRESAKRLNYYNHRTGKFWGKRYTDLDVLTHDDLMEAFLYVNTNPTKHGLLEDSAAWGGLTSYHQALSGADKDYSFYHYSKAEEEGKVTTHTLKLTPLPQLADMSQRERARILREKLDERTEKLVLERKEEGKGFLGIQGLREVTPGEIPQNVSNSPAPPCYTKDDALRLEYRKHKRALRRAYNYASMLYRAGDKEVKFPPFTYKPPCHRLPRVVPFTPLSLADLKNVDR